MSQPVRITEASERSPQLIAQLVDVWKASVRATHLFLSPQQVEEIKAYVPHALAEVEHLIVAETKIETESEVEAGLETEADGRAATKTESKADDEVEPEAKPANGASRILGFMGVQKRRLEMLFLEPDARKKGISRQLLERGIRNYSVRELTVNEQNPQAVGFYQHLGFQTYKRTDLDEQGAPYPLLYMRLETPV